MGRRQRSRGRGPGTPSEPPGPQAIAIVGLSPIRAIDGLRRFAARGARRSKEPRRVSGLVGIPDVLGPRAMGSRGLSAIHRRSSFRVDQFRIPPKELGEMLPQQSLMLRVAAEAIRDARWDDRLASRPAC